VRPPDRKLVDPADLVRLADAVPPRYRALVLVGGVLGLRWGEAIGLRTCDIDFVRRTVAVAQVVEEVSGRLRVLPGEAKTAGSLRTLAAPPFLLHELASHTEVHRGDKSRRPPGAPHRRPSRKHPPPSLRGADLPPGPGAGRLDPSLTFHGLRHVVMSTLVDENVHPRVIQSRAGHASSRLTMELYAHVTTTPTAGPPMPSSTGSARHGALRTGT